MDDAVRVGMLEGGADLLGNANDEVQVSRRLFVERRALDQFHHDKGLAAGLADVVDRDDVGVVEHGSGPGLAQQAATPLRRRLRDGQHLDSHIPSQQRIVGAVDTAHATLAKFGIQAVAIVEQRTDHRPSSLGCILLASRPATSWKGSAAPFEPELRAPSWR